MVCFETESDIDALIGIFGEMVIADIRKRKQKIGLALATLMSLDQVNVVVGKPDREIPFCTRTKNDGVDLIFDGQWYVTIVMRYSMYQVQSDPITGRLLNSPSQHLSRLIE